MFLLMTKQKFILMKNLLMILIKKNSEEIYSDDSYNEDSDEENADDSDISDEENSDKKNSNEQNQIYEIIFKKFYFLKKIRKILKKKIQVWGFANSLLK